MSKLHGVLTSCRFKRAQRTAAFPNFWSKANESVSECSRRPHIDEQGAKTYALQKRYRMWWKMLNNFYVPSISKATFYCCKRTTESCGKNFGQKKKRGSEPGHKRPDPEPRYLMFNEFWQYEKKTSKFYLNNRSATSNHSFKHPTALVMNVISWQWNPPLVKKIIGVEKTCEKSMNSVQGW